MEYTTPTQKVIRFTSDEYLKIGEIAERFWKRGVTGDPPTLAIFMAVSVPERQPSADGSVRMALCTLISVKSLTYKKAVGEDEPRLFEYVSMGSDMILRESINEKKNIVIEVIGESADLITPVMDSMKNIGYEIALHGITCDVTEAYKRHVQSVQEDPEYFSAARKQKATLAFFFNYFNSGPVPATALA